MTGDEGAPDLPVYSGGDDQRYDFAMSEASVTSQLHWRQEPDGVPWRTLVRRLTDTKKMSRKKGRGMFGGLLNHAASKECRVENCDQRHKVKASVERRSLIMLDCDDMDDGFVDRVKEQGWSGLLYTSHSHGKPGKGNCYRLILRPERAMANDEYGPVCRWVMDKIGGEFKDRSTTQFWRTMYLPTTPDPDTFKSWVLEGNLIDVDFANLMAPSAPNAEKRSTAGVAVGAVAYDGDAYEDLTDAQRAEVDADQASWAEWLTNGMTAYFEGEGDPLFNGENTSDGWDDQCRDLAFTVACRAVCPWAPFTRDDAVDLYLSLLPAEAHEDETRFVDNKIHRDGTWDKAAAATVSLPPWLRPAGRDVPREGDPSADEAFGSDDLDPEGLLGGAGVGGSAEGPPERPWRIGGPLPQGAPERSPRHGTWGPSAPLKVARHLKKSYTDHLRYWRADWWKWSRRAAAWGTYEPEALRRDVYNWLGVATYRKKDGDDWVDADWNPNGAAVSSVIDALRSQAFLKEGYEMPCWLDGDHRGAGPWIACADGVLRVKDRSLHENRGEFFNSFAVPFAYRGDVPEPVLWLAFLEQILPEADQRLLLQQFFGYVLSGRMDLEKGLLIIGPKRAGKGTIGTVLEALVGDQSCAAPTLHTLGGDFGMQSLLKARVAIMADVRAEGDKRVINNAIERLLLIIGRGPVEVNSKNKKPVKVNLTTVFMLMANEFPDVKDSATALVERFEILQLRKSFAGHEDTTLKDRLLLELPGIFKWALDGLELLGDGKLTQPESSKGAVQEFRATTAPILGWVHDCAETDPEATTPTEPPRRVRRLSSLRLQRLLGSGGERSEPVLLQRA